VSFMAGIAGAILIAMVGPGIASLALAFGPAEYLGLGLLSLTAIAALSGPSVLKGAIVTLVGMLLVTVGIDDSSGLTRMTFGQVALLEGFELVPVMIGLFGVGEVLRTLQEKNGELLLGTIGKLLPTAQEMRAGFKAGGRATGISLLLGLFPGMMPSIGSFLAYAVERNIAKDPSRFGKGAIEGVAASEAANNGTAMANLVPMLSLGIPTGPTTALMIAAFTMYGIVPGPLLFTQQSTLVWTLIGSFFVANAILLFMNLPLVGLWIRLAAIPYPILAPIILLTCIVGAYSTRSSLFDVWVCIGAGVVGWAMTARGWPMAPLILAYVLGPMIERSARQVIAISPELLLHRPVFWLSIAMAGCAIWVGRRMLIAAEVTD
jgi:putative tricarboxylic transport membrane protein